MGLSCQNCNAALKIFRGCDGNPRQPFLVDGKPLDRCPAKSLPAELEDYIQYYLLYKSKGLLFSGGALEQPNKIMQVFEIIEAAENEIGKNKLKELSDVRPKI